MCVQSVKWICNIQRKKQCYFHIVHKEQQQEDEDEEEKADDERENDEWIVKISLVRNAYTTFFKRKLINRWRRH